MIFKVPSNPNHSVMLWFYDFLNNHIPNLCLLWKMSCRKWWVSRRNQRFYLQCSVRPCMLWNILLVLWIILTPLTPLAVNGPTALLNDLHMLQFKRHQWRICNRQQFKSHSYHNMLTLSLYLNLRFHILPVFNVVTRNNQHQKMTQKPADIYKFLESCCPFVYRSPVRKQLIPLWSITSRAPSFILSSPSAEHTTSSCTDCQCT